MEKKEDEADESAVVSGGKEEELQIVPELMCTCSIRCSFWRHLEICRSISWSNDASENSAFMSRTCCPLWQNVLTYMQHT